MHKEQQFVKGLIEFLEDQCDSINFKDSQKAFALKENEKDQILKSMESSDIYKVFLKFDTVHNDRFGMGTNIAYVRGFSAGIKFIIFSLILKEIYK
jgi:hypothetical protein